MTKIRNLIGDVIYALGGLLGLAVLLRFIFSLIPFVRNLFQWYLNLTSFVAAPFSPAFPDWQVIGFTVSWNDLLALVVIVSLVLLLEQLLLTPFQTSLGALAVEFFISLFKVLEYLLVYRLFLQVLAASTQAPFVATIYDWTDKLFGFALGILPTVNVGPFSFNFAVVALLIIVIIVDFVVEKLLELIFGNTPRQADMGPSYRVKKITTIQYY